MSKPAAPRGSAAKLGDLLSALKNWEQSTGLSSTSPGDDNATDPDIKLPDNIETTAVASVTSKTSFLEDVLQEVSNLQRSLTPVDAWYQVLIERRQACMLSAKQMLSLYQRATTALSQTQNKHSNTFAQIWLEYARIQRLVKKSDEECKHTLQFMKSSGIGKRFQNFFLVRAAFEAERGNRQKAEELRQQAEALPSMTEIEQSRELEFVRYLQSVSAQLPTPLDASFDQRPGLTSLPQQSRAVPSTSTKRAKMNVHTELTEDPNLTPFPSRVGSKPRTNKPTSLLSMVIAEYEIEKASQSLPSFKPELQCIPEATSVALADHSRSSKHELSDKHHSYATDQIPPALHHTPLSTYKTRSTETPQQHLSAKVMGSTSSLKIKPTTSQLQRSSLQARKDQQQFREHHSVDLQQPSTMVAEEDNNGRTAFSRQSAILTPSTARNRVPRMHVYADADRAVGQEEHQHLLAVPQDRPQRLSPRKFHTPPEGEDNGNADGPTVTKTSTVTLSALSLSGTSTTLSSASSGTTTRFSHTSSSSTHSSASAESTSTTSITSISSGSSTTRAALHNSTENSDMPKLSVAALRRHRLQQMLDSKMQPSQVKIATGTPSRSSALQQQPAASDVQELEEKDNAMSVNLQEPISSTSRTQRSARRGLRELASSASRASTDRSVRRGLYQENSAHSLASEQQEKLVAHGVQHNVAAVTPLQARKERVVACTTHGQQTLPTDNNQHEHSHKQTIPAVDSNQFLYQHGSAHQQLPQQPPQQTPQQQRIYHEPSQPVLSVGPEVVHAPHHSHDRHHHHHHHQRQREEEERASSSLLHLRLHFISCRCFISFITRSSSSSFIVASTSCPRHLHLYP
eukprot:m.197385 g.197385  ORF g.197385 m.197385 type:complete len:856 (-) comp16825_c0_seq4:3867-6434(-)